MLESPAARLERMFAVPDADVDLARAALALARVEYPRLDPQPTIDWIDALAREIADALRGSREPDAVVEAINRAMFDGCGFRGNRHDYYDPRNSFLNDVVERRLGIPISLSVLYLEVARRLGAPIFGVALPGHFVVKYHDSRRQFFIDPYHQGRVLDRDGCRRLVEEVAGRRVDLTDLHFAAAENRSIVLRMCANLREIYLEARLYRKALGVIETMLALAPGEPEEMKQKAWLELELGRGGPALRTLADYLQTGPDTADAANVRDWMGKVRRGLSALN